MKAINELVYTKLGWDWVLEYASLIFLIAAVLVLLLIILFVTVCICHSKNKKFKKKARAKIQELKANGATDSGELRAQIRAEIEPIIRAEYERKNEGGSASNEEDKKAIADLKKSVAEKDAKIDELGAALAAANSAHNTNNNDLYRTINELSQTNRDIQNELNITKAENTQLKLQTRKQESAPAPAAEAQPKAARAPRAKKPAPAPAPEPVEEDDEDELIDDYGDDSSAVKVTLKYDRIKMNWVILRSDTDRTYRRVATKQEGLPIAKDLARRLHAQLVVYKIDGKFQKLQ